MSRCLRTWMVIAFAVVAPFMAAQTAHAQVIASDGFNRSDESPFTVGGNWGQVVAGNYQGNSNLQGNAVQSAFKEGIYYWQGAGTFDPTRQFARERVVQKNGELGLVLLGGADHSIMVAFGPPSVNDTVYIYWYKDGTDRGQLATGPATINNGDIIEAALENGIIYAKVNGVTVRSVANTTTLTTGTPGFITYFDPNIPSQISILDDWEGGTPTSYTISGTVTENASGLSGVLVTASGGFSGNATTAANGSYTISGVPSGATSIVLTPTLSAHTMSPLTRTVNGPVLANVTGQDFTSTQNANATLTILATGGTVTRNPDQPSYAFGTQVTLTPVADVGYTFAGWSGDVPVGQESANPLIVTMNADRTITAHFASEGVVASDHFDRPNELPFATGGNWQKSFAGGGVDLINNHVASNNGEAVYYWQGPGAFQNARQFARLKVLQAGGQVGLVLLGSSGKALVASWGSGRLFIYWYNNGSHQGELANISAPLQDGDVIEAVLDAGTVYAIRNGVVVTSVPNTTSLTSGKPGFETFQSGAVFDDWEAGLPPSFTISGTITENLAGISGVLVTASGGFSGSATTGAGGSYTINGVPPGATSILLTPTLLGHTMTPTTRTVAGPVSADVTGQDFTSESSGGAVLTVNATHGSVVKDPDQTVFPFGSLVTLTPVPDAGYQFVAWTGDVPAGHATDNPLQLTMNQDRTVTAVFQQADVLASDQFNRANEFPLAEGGNWQRAMAGGLSNLVNQRVQGASGEAVYYWNGPGTFDPLTQFARVKVVQPNGQIGLVLLGGVGQGLVVAWNNNSSGGTLFIYWYSGGSYHGNLATFSSVIQAGDIIEGRLEGGVVYAKINGVIVASTPNTTTLSGGKPGFETFQTDQIFDDWEAGPAPCGAEVCDGVDNDCDGSTDEGDPGGGGACTTGQPGVCSAGTLHCSGGGLVCQPNTPSSAEVCDGLDNDCDGTTDEGQLCSDGDACTTDSCQGGTCSSAPLSCNDGNPCTDDSCNPATGCQYTNNTASCSDGNACTTGDACSGGACVGGAATSCNDNNVCTNDSCNPTTGLCEHVNNTASCSDGNACTTGDTCSGGSCVGGTPVVCNDNNVCTDDSCNPTTGLCEYVSNTASCSDGNACTTGDACSGGACVGGTATICNDNNVCTDDSCNPTTGQCEHVNNTASCSDGNACTVGDACSGGSCVAGSPTVCNDNNVCTNDSCNPTTGLCEYVNNTASCSDGNACTTGDACSGGACVGGTATICNDNNVCTDDSCNPTTGQCEYTNNTASCDDGNACTTGDTCSGGSCVAGTGAVCDDGNPCTDDTCVPLTGICLHVPNSGNSCSDGNACTTGDSCLLGVCVPGTSTTCNDGNACTNDSCNPATGLCEYVNNTSTCDDGNACTTGDACSGGACVGGAAVTCDDNNACTDDACNPATGLCEYVVDDTNTCSDGNACTVGDACAGGSCVAGTPTVCNDNNACTDDACNPATGLCDYVADDTNSCDDGNLCTTGDACVSGACVATPVGCSDGNACTNDVCNPATGACSHVNNTASCDDGNACTSGDTCSAGACVGGAAVTCNDNNPCTDDSCNPATGCHYANNTAGCDDGNACTSGDTCAAGVCVGGAAVVCNDNNVCTNDSCNPATGCEYVNNTASCDDGNACTTGDTCSAGICVGGSAVSCNDNNVCTDDSCNPATGCQHANNTASCTDGNACTSGDTCSAGACVAGTPVVCSDNNACTDDACNPTTGACVFTADNTNTCSDGNACTTGDHCSAAACVAGTPIVCNDNNACTDDACNPANGQCVFAADNTNTCTDGNACTSDACVNGSCVATLIVPGEVQGVRIDRNHPTKISWTAVAGLLYDVASSTLSDLRQHGTTTATCAKNDAGSSYNDNRPNPAVGDGYYYIVRAQSTCGSGTYGHQTDGLERLPTAACP